MIEFDWKRLRTDTEYRRTLTRDVQVDDVLREDGRQLCKTNFLALGYVLGYTKLDPEVHVDLLSFFWPRDLSRPVDQQGTPGMQDKGTGLFPRGFYKSTASEVDEVQEIICFPTDSASCIEAGNLELARALVDSVAAHFERGINAGPTLFQALFPEMCVRPPRAGTWGGRFSPPTRRLQPPIKESALMAFSVESGASGWHFHRMKCDDIANNRNMGTETSQANVWRNFITNRKLLNPGGIEIKLGTRYGPNDPYGMERKNARPGSYRYVAKGAVILRSGERLDANGFPPEHEVICPFAKMGLNYEMLRSEYEADYSSFMLQYMNDAFGDAEVTFSEDMMRAAYRPTIEMPVLGDPLIHWRLAHKGNGWTHAAGVVGKISGNRLFIVDALFGAWKPSALAAKIVNLAREWGATSVQIEDSPGARKNEAPIQNYALTRRAKLDLEWVPYQMDAGERDNRIKHLEPLITSGRLMMDENLTNMRRVHEQFCNFGIIDQNALPDAVSQLAEHLPESIENTEQTILDNAMAAERDHFNFYFGQGVFPADLAPVVEEIDVDAGDDFSPRRDAFGFDEIMPGLNG